MKKVNLSGRHFINLEDFTSEELSALIDYTFELKSKVRNREEIDIMKNRTMVMYFSKPSLRTRLSFEIGMKKLGGDAFVLKQDEIILGQRESIEDSSNVISRYCDLIMIRTFAHSDVEDFAKYSKVPVINALTDLSHPCQVMADLFTMKEHFGKLKGLTLTYIGDGNNVCNSLLTGCTSLGVNIKVGVPKGYEPDAKTIEVAKNIAKNTGCTVDIVNDVKEAVSGADVVYTDVWASMGQESEKEKRLNIFKGFTLTKELFDLANKGAIALHCLPAHKGEEISEEVFNMNSQYIYEEAENRMHAQMAIMSSIVKE
ncbi:ornithine carbamoyltransferase [Brachyspira hyodysenteriae]|uniref:Ornithine carbamoyltransferase, catabolic n=1 Tax=Brachyspira hyodysenteriae (strain ATCC 49526 / WA1) TaxID=565034 RepID=A0A3B6VG74_BRAHW|nr:ornithine carbamoyltransferase [Brachyspira hyodysenteriae]ACN83964.1 ornithine carbamoyltransferase [Brachyspira hyodysenteriae WA1]AUJ49690.1 ornithine carbamoyltransferase [Brachyspira hyodysenteriae]KLI16229.1 ornithine carbamoyltransferase [Brachyspira hyodysenteriae]KLI31390.1 ornithine carbamoyltransferase [Brachyspira hyodysenteriae]KLI45414.1 ornithine carbamoyltransferase [Brachyspira hyodysenteriae]